MKFGLSMFGYGPRHYAKVAVAAEAAGFDSVWLSEHLVFPTEIPATYPYDESGRAAITPDTALFDVWVIAAAIAQATETIRMGSCVYILPLRHPLITARSLVTLDHVSNGRVILGAGVGWLEDEFAIMGESFKDRGRRADEVIPLLRRLWTEDVIEHHGEHFQFAPVKFQPKPRRGSIPIQIGGSSPVALRRAAWLGDGWIETGVKSFEELGQRLDFLNGARREAGREHLPFEVTVTLGAKGVPVTEETFRRLQDMGVDRVIVHPARKEGEKNLGDAAVEWARQYGGEMISKFV